MLKLTSKITIEGEKTWEFYSINNCSIVKDITSLTDTCELTLPKKIVWQGLVNDNFKTPLKRGDKVTVELGYDGKLKTRFTGFIKTVDAKTPVVIKCEDSMFLLKQKKVVPKAFKNALLKDVMTHILEGTGINFELVDNTLQVGNYRTSKPTVADELQELKEKYMLNSYFRTINGKNVLYVGLIYPLDNREKYKFVYGKNIISEDFEYQDRAEIKAKVEALSFDNKHRKINVELGDEDGDVIKIRIDGLTEPELKKYAQESLERYKQGGLKGSFETFGQPEVNTCDIVEIFPGEAKNGVYLIKKNEISFGINGYRQKIELGQPLSPLKDIIQALAATGDEVYAKICEVLEIDDENKTADLRPLDGSADILDAYLVTDDANGSMYLEPAKGSLVCVVFISKQIACVVNPSELKQFRVKIKGVEFQMDQEGFLLKKESETLKALMADLIKEIRKMKFTTNTGSTIQLVNDLQFSLIEDRFKNFLKD